LGAAQRPFRKELSARPRAIGGSAAALAAGSFNERSGGLLNRTQYPSDVIALAVLWRLRYKLALRDLPEMFLISGIVFSHETVREWEAKLTPALAEGLRRRRRGKAGCSWSWYVDETYLKVNGRWCYLYRRH
jgi:transposase-like protein